MADVVVSMKLTPKQAGRLYMEHEQLKEKAGKLEGRIAELEGWISSLVGMSNHGINNLAEYECLQKSSTQIIREVKEVIGDGAR